MNLDRTITEESEEDKNNQEKNSIRTISSDHSDINLDINKNEIIERNDNTPTKNKKAIFHITKSNTNNINNKVTNNNNNINNYEIDNYIDNKNTKFIIPILCLNPVQAENQDKKIENFEKPKPVLKKVKEIVPMRNVNFEISRINKDKNKRNIISFMINNE